jgi:hypothetical protein
MTLFAMIFGTWAATIMADGAYEIDPHKQIKGFWRIWIHFLYATPTGTTICHLTQPPSSYAINLCNYSTSIVPDWFRLQSKTGCRSKSRGELVTQQ